MNPCWKISLFEGARYIAITDFIYSALAIILVLIQLISIAAGRLEAISSEVLSSASVTQVLSAYLSIYLVNLSLSIVLHRGVLSDDVHKCKTFLIISTLSTSFGILIVIYHGIHLPQLSISLLNSEFFISALYHAYKLYALFVIVAFVIELNDLVKDDEGSGEKRARINYHSLESTNQEEESDEIAKFIFYNIPFSANRVVDEDQLQIDYETCLEFDETTSTLKGTLTRISSEKEVALKMLKTNFRADEHMISLVKEAKLMCYISNHQHIIQLLGICCTASDTVRGNVTLIMETFPPRRLDNFLKDSFQNQLQNFSSLVGTENGPSKTTRKLGTVYENFEANFLQLEPFSTINMIQWAYQLSSAMDFLHSKKVVFGNLQARSLILMNISQIKLSDFSFASELWENNFIPASKLYGNVSQMWTAVECLFAANQGYLIEFNEKTDVWSFGSTLLEIFNMGHMPKMTSVLSDYARMLSEGKRPDKPKYASDGIYNMIKMCWNLNPSDRPGFNVISLFFRQILSKSIFD